MDNFISTLENCRPAAGTIAVFWLGQASYIVKTAGLKVIGIDLYLSDFVGKSFPEMGLGFKRLTPPPCRAEDLRLDALLISHEHADHYDADSIDALLMDRNIPVVTTPTVAEALRARGLDQGRVTALRPGGQADAAGCRITAVDSDHGELSADAIGFLMDFGITTLYYAGDTALSMERLELALKARPDIAILPINGAFGNLDGIEAARLAGALQARYCIPCHFWTFPLHRGDPQQIIDALPSHAPDCQLCLFRQGEGMVFPRSAT